MASHLDGFLSGDSLGGTVSRYRDKQNIYTQGAPAYTLFYIQQGSVRLTTRTKNRPSAVTAILGVNDLFGELLPRGLSSSRVHSRGVDRQLHTYHQERKDAPTAPQEK